MKRLMQLSVLGLVLAVPGLLAAPEAGETGSTEIWQWVNFGLLLVFLGYVIGKYAGPFFEARSRKIREDMAQAEEMWKSAEASAAEVDRRLAGLESEIAAFRAASQQEAQSETQRMRTQTAAEIARVQQHAEQEIAAAGKAARLELKRYAAELAIQVAAQKVRNRITSDTQDGLVREFVRDLEHPSNGSGH